MTSKSSERSHEKPKLFVESAQIARGQIRDIASVRSDRLGRTSVTSLSGSNAASPK
jgi:enhancing lycopene biosynthesis protein 2